MVLAPELGSTYEEDKLSMKRNWGGQHRPNNSFLRKLTQLCRSSSVLFEGDILTLRFHTLGVFLPNTTILGAEPLLLAPLGNTLKS